VNKRNRTDKFITTINELSKNNKKETTNLFKENKNNFYKQDKDLQDLILKLSAKNVFNSFYLEQVGKGKQTDENKIKTKKLLKLLKKKEDELRKAFHECPDKVDNKTLSNLINLSLEYGEIFTLNQINFTEMFKIPSDSEHIIICNEIYTDLLKEKVKVTIRDFYIAIKNELNLKLKDIILEIKTTKKGYGSYEVVRKSSKGKKEISKLKLNSLFKKVKELHKQS